jgi:hypothetical protein
MYPERQREKHNRFVLLGATAAVMLLAHSLIAQPSTLPVYYVTQSGATPAQADVLASSLGIPAGAYSTFDGIVSFIDPTNYLSVPTVDVTDASVVDLVTSNTINRDPSIPLAAQALDFSTLSNLTFMTDAAWFNGCDFALAYPAGKTQSATHVPRH